MNKLLRMPLLFVAASAIFLAARGCRADQPFPLDGAQLTGVTTSTTPQGLEVDYGIKDAWPNILWSAPSASGWDWSHYAALVLTLSNPGGQDVSFHIKIDDRGATGKKHSTTLSGAVAAGQTETFYVSLESRTAQERAGMRSLPSVANPDYGTPLGGGIEPAHIDNMQIFRAMPTVPATLVIHSIVLAGDAQPLDLTGIVDRYGQYTRADWSGKVHDDGDLAAQNQTEIADLKAHPAPPDRDKWGGWLGGPRERATGFFRTKNADGKWWLVDPDGNLFLSVGVDVVRPDLSTTVAGREAMFRWLPAASDPLAKYYGGGGTPPKTYDFLGANRERKYGPVDDSAFGDRAVARLKSWGFNTLGNWSIEAIGQDRRFPYVVALAAKGDCDHVPSGIRYGGGAMPDPFDPRFAANVDASVWDKAAIARNDPACLGYFFDNELSWGTPTAEKEHYGLCYGALSLGPESPAKQAFLALLQSRYGSIAALNAAWGTQLASWAYLAAPYQAVSPIASDRQRKDFSDFLSAYADQYFRIVATTIKRYDPNHLYLGCRFAYWFTPEAVRLAAKYVDVISFNIYNWNRATYLFAESLNKPCLVGEFHFGATDRGMFSGDITVKDQTDRGAHYAQYVRDVLSEPAFVGCQWFQYYDEPTTGRSGDGENFNIGFLSITDTPYAELIAAARGANARIYGWHGGG